MARLGARVWRAFVVLSLTACSTPDVRKPHFEFDVPWPESSTPHLPGCLQFCPDEDGDGRGAGATVSDGCEEETAEAPPGHAACYEDCDDADPSVFALAARDEDGDGYGLAGRGQVCVGPLPEDFTYGARPLDCNDTNPDVRPDAPEQWLDGVDSNCDGIEDPDDCSADAFDSTPVEVDTDCGDEADLFLARVFGCLTPCAYERKYVVLGNRGGGSVDGRVVLTLIVDGHEPRTTNVSLTLEPGARSNPLALPPSYTGSSELRVERENGPADCDPSNDTERSSVDSATCN